MGEPKPAPSVGVGMPALLKLELFAGVVHDAFGEWPYLVGSAARGKVWRDVDVRVMLGPEEWQRFCGASTQKPERLNRQWTAFCLAFSELGRIMTGLPIDFQLQERDEANRLWPNEVRMPLIATGVWEPAVVSAP